MRGRRPRPPSWKIPNKALSLSLSLALEGKVVRVRVTQPLEEDKKEEVCTLANV
jgi:hypothetical protein